MKSKKFVLSKIWEPEDSQIFGELFLIIASIFLSIFIEKAFPDLSRWWYLGLAFLLVLFGVKLLRTV